MLGLASLKGFVPEYLGSCSLAMLISKDDNAFWTTLVQTEI